MDFNTEHNIKTQEWRGPPWLVNLVPCYHKQPGYMSIYTH